MPVCEDCRLAEMTTRERMIEAVTRCAAWAFGFGPSRPVSVARMAASMGRILILAAGGREPTWYERHRDAWVATGERIELDRMLRHVR